MTVMRRTMGSMDELRDPAAVVPGWTLGWRLQRALAHAGLTTEEIAAELGVSRSTISRWLNDRGAPPRPVYIRMWALRCGVPYGWLKEGDTTTAKAVEGVSSRRSWTPLTLTYLTPA